MADELLIQELLAEKESLDSSFVHCLRLLNQEISRVQSIGSNSGGGEENLGIKTDISTSDYNGNIQSTTVGNNKPKTEQEGDSSQGSSRQPRPRSFRRPGEYLSEEVIKLTEKVFIPVKEYPKFNFVGKILGPRGNTLKRLQAQTGTKMSILGKGSMRDKEKEEELRNSGDSKYDHLQEPLHVLIEVEAPQTDAHMRLATAIAELKKYMRPENDEIREQQMQEMAYIKSLEDPSKVPVPPLPPLQVHQLPVRSRGRAVIRSPAGLARGAGIRGGKVRGVPGALRPAGTVVTSRHLAPASDPYRKVKGARREEADAEFELGAAAAYESYDTVYDTTYETAYPDTSEVFYDYGGGAEEYEYAPASSAGSITSYKATPVRPVKRALREAAYPY